MHRRSIALLAVAALAASCGDRGRPSSPVAAPGTSVELRLDDWGVAAVSEVEKVRIVLAGTPPKLSVTGVSDRLRHEATVPERPGKPLQFVDELAVLAPMSSGGFNRLGGSFAPFARKPSRASVDIVDDGARFSFDKARAGFAGFWIHLFDDRAARRDRVYLDTSGARFLMFEIRGARGGENVALQVADGRWEARGDSVRVGPISDFLAGKRVTRRWQRAVVPIEALDKIDRQRLASFVVVADRGGEGRVFIRNLAFATSDAVTLPPHRAPGSATRPMRVAMWVWTAAELARSTGEIGQLVALCRQRQVSDIFLQVPAPATEGGLRVAADLAVLEPLVRALVAAGVRVEALDGAPSLALAENHRKNQATVAAVIDYNRGRPARARFAGVRFDNEPYLLPGFHGPRQAAISRQYLAALEKAATLAHTAGLTMGADIPFWFDTYNAFDELGAGLEGRPLSELVLERVDNISIMDYRTEAFGADGVVAHAWNELEFASSAGKQVFVALETEDLPDERHEEYIGPPTAAAPILVLVPRGDGRVLAHRFEPEDRLEADALVAGNAGARALGRKSELFLDAGKLTFADKHLSDLDEVIAQSWRDLSRSPSLVGVAIHSYESYRRWQARATSAGADR